MNQLFIILKKWEIFNKDNQSGYVLPLVLVILALVSGISAIILPQMLLDLRTNSEYRDFQYTVFVAKSAMEECQGQLAADPGYIGTGGNVDVGSDATYSIKVQQASESLRAITIKSTYKSIYKREYTGQAEYDTDGKLCRFSMSLVPWNSLD